MHARREAASEGGNEASGDAIAPGPSRAGKQSSEASVSWLQTGASEKSLSNSVIGYQFSRRRLLRALFFQREEAEALRRKKQDEVLQHRKSESALERGLACKAESLFQIHAFFADQIEEKAAKLEEAKREKARELEEAKRASDAYKQRTHEESALPTLTSNTQSH